MNAADSPNRTLRILCVDDNAMVADALRNLVLHDPSLQWVGWLGDGTKVMDRARSLAPDVVLMDLDIPGTDTLALVERLAAELPAVRTVIFSGHVHPTDIDRAMDCGAWGYLSKNEDVDALIECIRQVGRGEIALSKEVMAVKRSAAR